MVWSFINWQFSGVFLATAESRPPHPACLHFMASTTSRRVVHHILPNISRSSEWLDAYYFSYNNMPSYSHAPNNSVRMQTTNISLRERSQSSHKVPKRRRLAPSWDVVDDRPPHQLVHGENSPVAWSVIMCIFNFAWFSYSILSLIINQVIHIPTICETQSKNLKYFWNTESRIWSICLQSLCGPTMDGRPDRRTMDEWCETNMISTTSLRCIIQWYLILRSQSHLFLKLAKSGYLLRKLVFKTRDEVINLHIHVDDELIQEGPQFYAVINEKKCINVHIHINIYRRNKIVVQRV